MVDDDAIDGYLRRALTVIAELETENVEGVDRAPAQKLVSSELAELESLAASHPLRADEIEAVAARYRAARIRLQHELGSILKAQT